MDTQKHGQHDRGRIVLMHVEKNKNVQETNREKVQLSQLRFLRFENTITRKRDYYSPALQ